LLRSPHPPQLKDAKLPYVSRAYLPVPKWSPVRRAKRCIITSAGLRWAAARCTAAPPRSESGATGTVAGSVRVLGRTSPQIATKSKVDAYRKLCELGYEGSARTVRPRTGAGVVPERVNFFVQTVQSGCKSPRLSLIGLMLSDCPSTVIQNLLLTIDQVPLRVLNQVVDPLIDDASKLIHFTHNPPPNLPLRLGY